MKKFDIEKKSHYELEFQWNIEGKIRLKYDEAKLYISKSDTDNGIRRSVLTLDWIGAKKLAEAINAILDEEVKY